MEYNVPSIADKLNAIAQVDTTWREKAEQRQANKNSLRLSAKIAFRILDTLRQNRLSGKNPNSQKELAELLDIKPQQINRIVKGEGNLTLDTVSRLEVALQVPLVDIYKEAKAQQKAVIVSATTVTNIVPPAYFIIPSSKNAFQISSNTQVSRQPNTNAEGSTQYAMAA